MVCIRSIVALAVAFVAVTANPVDIQARGKSSIKNVKPTGTLDGTAGHGGASGTLSGHVPGATGNGGGTAGHGGASGSLSGNVPGASGSLGGAASSGGAHGSLGGGAGSYTGTLAGSVGPKTTHISGVFEGPSTTITYDGPAPTGLFTFTYKLYSSKGKRIGGCTYAKPAIPGKKKVYKPYPASKDYKCSTTTHKCTQVTADYKESFAKKCPGVYVSDSWF